MNLYHRVIARTVGYDVFIAYRQRDARSYAKALHDALEKRRLVVFLDEADEEVGAKIEQFKRIACTARTLVVIVTGDVYESVYVRQEVEAYQNNRLRSWWRRSISRMIPINVDNALSHPPVGDDVWMDLGASVFVSEDGAAVKEAMPSTEVVDRIARAGRLVRSGLMFALMLGFLTALIVGALGIGIWQLRRVNRQRAMAEAERNELKTEAEGLEDQKRKLETENTELNEKTSALQTQERDLRGKVAELEGKERALTAQNKALSLQERALRTRAKALQAIAVDPVIAYRLAEHAEGILPAAENRELMRQAISSTDLLYANVVVGFSVDDVLGSTALLRSNGEPRRAHGSLLLLDLENGSRQRLPHPAGDSALLVSNGSSWRILVAQETEEGRHYQLYDADGSPHGAPVVGRRSVPRELRCSPTLAFVPSRESTGVRWNLATNERSTIRYPATDVALGRVFLACRADGSWASISIGTIELVDDVGQIVQGSQTKVSFDFLSSSTRWSSSTHYLAVHIPDGALVGEPGRIGVWDPSAASFVWLDPDRWLATAYAWSPSGRTLAFAGHTSNMLDSTVEVTQPETPMQSRHVVYQGAQPIQRIAFSPDERELALLDDLGTLALVDLSGVKPVRKAKHVGAKRLWWEGDRLVTSSTENIRVWTTIHPRERWLFRSDAERRFHGCAAADTGWIWHAAVFSGDAQGTHSGGVLVRDLRTGQERKLDASHDTCHQLAFSRDSRWLVLVTSEVTWVWRTDTWKAYTLPLEVGDGQYIGMHEGTKGIVLHALGADWMSNTKNNKLYDVRLDIGAGPRIVGREPIAELPKANCPPSPSRLVEGWRDALERSRYRVMGRASCPNVGWEIRTWCRDDALIAEDCDHEFVPTDLQRATQLWDRAVWHTPSTILDGEGGQ